MPKPDKYALLTGLSGEEALEPQHIFAIGGSAGSISSLKELLAQLPPDLKAAVFIVVHLRRSFPSNLSTVLSQDSPLPVQRARHQAPIEIGRVYVATPDCHLFLRPGKVQLIRGPLENHTRPAIDVLFRSAAVAYRESATGIILSGLLGDGTAGLQAIKRCGGTAIVQSPEDAAFRSMPENAIANNEVDHIVPVAEMGQILLGRTQQKPSIQADVPQDLQMESQMVERSMSRSEEMALIGKMVPQNCPACGGPLWHIQNSDTLRYRCHVGHGFTALTLAEAQDAAAEEALWTALRTLEERGRLLQRISEDNAQKGLDNLAQRYRERAVDAIKHAETIRQLLYSLDPPDRTDITQ